MKQTMFKNTEQETIRIQELNHKLDKNQREREAINVKFRSYKIPRK